MNRRITKVALVAAAAMTMSLASPVTANASESTGFAASRDAAPTLSRSAASVTPSATVANALGRFSVRHGVISRRGNNAVTGTVAPAVDGYDFKADVYVNRKKRGTVDLYSGGFYYPSTWRAGAVRLGPVHYTDASGTPQVVNQYSNYFRIRQAVKWNYSPITKRGSKLTFKLRGFKTFNGTHWVSVKRVKLQVKKGKKWKTIKNVKVNKSGSKKFTLKSKKKRAYRVYIPTTTRIKGSVSRATKI